MDTLGEILEQADAELATVSDKLSARRRRVVELDELIGRWSATRQGSAPFRVRRRGVALTINEDAIDGGSGTRLRLNVEVLGARVGSVEFAPGRGVTFAPNPAFGAKVRKRCASDRLLLEELGPAFETWGDPPPDQLPWTRDNETQTDTRVRELLLAAARIQARARVQQRERVIQWNLGAAFRSSDKNPEGLRGLRPVLLAGAPIEFSTVLTAHGVGTGNVDLIVRTRTRGKLLVVELKQPGVKAGSALKQAIRYARSLEMEVSGASEHEQRSYRRLFGMRSPGRLTFGAVAAVEATQRPDAMRCLERLGTAAHQMDIRVLLYTTAAPGSTELLPHGYSWLPGR